MVHNSVHIVELGVLVGLLFGLLDLLSLNVLEFSVELHEERFFDLAVLGESYRPAQHIAEHLVQTVLGYRDFLLQTYDRLFVLFNKLSGLFGILDLLDETLFKLLILLVRRTKLLF